MAFGLVRNLQTLDEIATAYLNRRFPMDENETNQAATQPYQEAGQSAANTILTDADAPEPQVDAFGLPPLTTEKSAGDQMNELGDDASKWAAAFCETAAKLGHPGIDEGWMIGWFANAIEHSSAIRRTRFTAALHPDDATARCIEILDNMHGSDDQRRKVVRALVERFAP